MRRLTFPISVLLAWTLFVQPLAAQNSSVDLAKAVNQDFADDAIGFSHTVFKFLSDEGILLIVGLWSLGAVLKKIPIFPNDFIPLTIFIAAEVACFYMFFERPAIEIALLGFFAAAVTGYTYDHVIRYMVAISGKLGKLAYRFILREPPPDATKPPFPPDQPKP